MADPMAAYYRHFDDFLEKLMDTMTGTRLCDDCCECPATETWDYSHAPIPNPPSPEHLCERCADSRRDADYERKMEG